MQLVVCAAPRLKAEHRAEVTAEVAELLRRGYSPVHLERSILDPERDRSEYPRRWRERVSKSKPLRESDRAAQALADRQQAAQEAAAAKEALRRVREAGGLAGLARRRAAGNDVGELLGGSPPETN